MELHFFLQNCLFICLQLILEKSIVEHRLNARGVVSLNQRCLRGNICLRRLNEDNGLFCPF